MLLQRSKSSPRVAGAAHCFAALGPSLDPFEFPPRIKQPRTCGPSEKGPKRVQIIPTWPTSGPQEVPATLGAFYDRFWNLAGTLFWAFDCPLVPLGLSFPEGHPIMNLGTLTKDQKRFEQVPRQLNSALRKVQASRGALLDRFGVPFVLFLDPF